MLSAICELDLCLPAAVQSDTPDHTNQYPNGRNDDAQPKYIDKWEFIGFESDILEHGIGLLYCKFNTLSGFPLQLKDQDFQPR